MKPNENEIQKIQENKWIYGSRLGNSLDHQSRKLSEDELGTRMRDCFLILLFLDCLFVCSIVG